MNDLWIIVLLALLGARAFEALVGPCVYDFEEPCTNQSVKFFAFADQEELPLDPFRLRLPAKYLRSVGTGLGTIKIVIHGFGGRRELVSRILVDAYVEVGANVIFVDWDRLAKLNCYSAAVVNTWQAAKCTAILISSLISVGYTPEDIHIVGFSLGAHVAGMASINTRAALGRHVGRITGLDPALPFITAPFLDWKLDATDADFVDVVHTNAGTFGKIETAGHVDFYVNGGSLQPACVNKTNPALCSHLSAPIYWAESITTNVGFIGMQCPNWFFYHFSGCPNTSRRAEMGEWCNPNTRGVYYLKTSYTTPYALGLT